VITSRQPDGQVRVVTVLPNRERLTVETFLKHIACLFAAAPAVKLAYDLRNALTAIFDAPITKEEATRQLQAWMQRVQDSGMDAFDRFLAMLTTHLDGITNYFHHRANSGFVEGINTKARVLTRRCYGIFNLRYFSQRLTLDVEGAAAVTRCMAPHYMRLLKKWSEYTICSS
jgi:transposase